MLKGFFHRLLGHGKPRIVSAVGSAAGKATAQGRPGAILSRKATLDHPLDLAIARVNRAEEHLIDLVRRLNERGQRQLDAITIEPHPNEPKQIAVNPTKLLGFDHTFSILVGEICYNLRAALDYLIYELAILDSKRIQNGTQFPIEDKPEGFAWRIKGGWLKGLNPKHMADIERLQPYNGCKWAARLRDISNPDKHRTLTATQATNQLTIHVVDPAHIDDVADMTGPIRSAKTGDGTEVYVKFMMSAEIQFEDGSPVIEPIEEIKNEIARTLIAFKPEFK